MKKRKMNRKKKSTKRGFTLVELLAIIILLAIAIGITIPIIINTVNDSKNDSLHTATNIAESWLKEQAIIYNTNTSLVDKDFPKQLALDLSQEYNPVENTPVPIILSSTTSSQKSQIKAMGFKIEDVQKITIQAINGKVCVKVTSIGSKSTYYNIKYWKKSGSYYTPKSEANTKNMSDGCS